MLINIAFCIYQHGFIFFFNLRYKKDISSEILVFCWNINFLTKIVKYSTDFKNCFEIWKLNKLMGSKAIATLLYYEGKIGFVSKEDLKY